MPFDLAAPNIPIVGQVIKLSSCVMLPLFECQCGSLSGTAVQLIVLAADGRINAAPAQCRGCGNVYTLQGFDMVDGGLRFNLQIIKSTQQDS